MNQQQKKKHLGAIRAQAFESHHNAQDWAYFINKLIFFYE